MDSRSIAISPLNGSIGAELSGIDLARPLSDDVREQIFQAFLDYKVLVFRGHVGLPPAVFADFCRTFGALHVEDHPHHRGVDGVPEVKVLRSNAGKKDNLDDPAEDCNDDREHSWHRDGSCWGSHKYLWASALHAIDVPPFGRDTGFVDMERVFYRLSPTMQDFLSGLKATHSWGWVKPGAPTVEHDVAPVHPRTGRRSLYVSTFDEKAIGTTGIVGLRPDESENLLKFLLSKVHRLEFQLRVSWQPGTIVVWDDARTLHYPIMDRGYPRVMHRVEIVVPEQGSPWQKEIDRVSVAA